MQVTGPRSFLFHDDLSAERTRETGEIITDFLASCGLNNVFFGIGGDYISAFLPFLQKKFSLISSSSELNAGYSAIANSILNKQPAATIVTWNVGSLAQLENMKYAQENNVPVLFISGGLGSGDIGESSAHHAVSSVKTEGVDDRMVSVNAARSIGVRSLSLFPENGISLIDNEKVFKEERDARKIMEMLAESLVYLRAHSKPVYIEIPRDLPVTRVRDNFSGQILNKLTGHKGQEFKFRPESNKEDSDFLSFLGLRSPITAASPAGEETILYKGNEKITDGSALKKVIERLLGNAIFIADNHRGLGINYAVAGCRMPNDSVPVLFTTEELFERKGVDELLKLTQGEKKCVILLFTRKGNRPIDYSQVARKAGLLGRKAATYQELIDAIEDLRDKAPQSSLLLDISVDLYPAMFEEKIENLSAVNLKDTFSGKLLNLLSKESCGIVYKGDHFSNGLFGGIFKSDSRFKVISSPESISSGYAAGVVGRRSYNLGIGLFDSVTGANGIANAIAENYPMLVLYSPPRDEDTTLQTAEALGVKAVKIDSLTANPMDQLNEAVQYAKENSAPVYLEISKEVLLSNCPDLRGKAVDSPVDKTDLATKARDLISTISALPVEEKIYIYLGEKFAFNPRLIDLIKEFSELTNIPVANSLYIKSAFPEDFPLSLGTYWGPFSKVETVRFIHQASYAIKLGEPNMVRDLGSGFGTWEEKKSNSFLFKGEYVDGRDMEIFIHYLIEGAKKGEIPKRDFPKEYQASSLLFGNEEYENYLEKKITLRDCYKVAAAYISRNHRSDIINLFDCGTAWFGGLGMYNGVKDSFFASNFYASMGFGVPALDAITEVQPEKLPVLITGDGAFQMTGFSGMIELIRARKKAVVIIFRNDKYALGSKLQSPINDTAMRAASYSGMAQAMGGNGIDNLQTFQDLLNAIEKAKDFDGPTLIEIKYDDADRPRESWLVDTWIAMMRGDEKAKETWNRIKSGEISDVSE